MKIYKWILFDEFKQVIAKGVLEESVDVFIDKIFPNEDSSCDRCLWEMQEYADRYYKDKKYRFFYTEEELDFDDFIKESLEWK